VKLVRPSELMREAAAVLEPVRDDVVIVGAVAIQVALDGQDVALTPTRDIDAGVDSTAVDRVVGQLEASGLTPSDIPHERSFTWVKGELKVQLLRPFHPFPRGSAKGLPVNNILPELDRHRVASPSMTRPTFFASGLRAQQRWSASRRPRSAAPVPVVNRSTATSATRRCCLSD
jgi:hypothetical protein